MRTNALQLLLYAAVATSGTIVPLVAARQGAGLELIGVIGAAHGLAGVLSSFIFGRLGDRAERRRLIRIGFLLSAVAFASQAFATTADAYLLSRFLVGFAAGIVPAALVAYVYEIRRPLGKFTSFNAMGWLVGSGLIVIAGLLEASTFRWAPLERVRASLADVGVFELLFAASALACLVGWWLARRLEPMHVRLDVPRFPWRLMAANAHVYVAFMFRHVGAHMIWIVFPLYIIELGGDLTLLGWLHVANMVAQVLLLRNAESWGRYGHPRFLIASGLLLSALVFGGYAMVTEAWALIPLQAGIGLSFAALYLGSLKEILEHNVERSTASGILNASMSFSNVLGPLLGGLVAWKFGFVAVMYAGAGLTLAALLYFSATGRRRRTPGPHQALAPRPVGEVGP